MGTPQDVELPGLDELVAGKTIQKVKLAENGFGFFFTDGTALTVKVSRGLQQWAFAQPASSGGSSKSTASNPESISA